MPRPESSPAPERQVGSAVRGARGPAASPPAAAWIREHLDAVYRYARRRLSAADAEDVAQCAFEALFRAHAEGRAPREDAAYLLGTARRRVADLLRRRARGREPVALPEGWEGFATERLPDEALATAELRDLVATALGLLPGTEAQLLIDRYRRGASTADVAARLGVSPKAVELRLRRARQAFARRFLEIGRDWTSRAGDGGEAA